MTRLSALIFVSLVIGSFFNVSADVVKYNVTFIACIPGSTCPTGNPTTYNKSFALNGILSPNINLKVGDQLQFYLVTDVPSHPLTICRNSSSPQFCQGVATSNQLSTPITTAGTTSSVNFTTIGTYYYGCYYHPGMGAIINVTSGGYQLSARFLFIVTFALLIIIFM